MSVGMPSNLWKNLKKYADSFEALTKADPLAKMVVDYLRVQVATTGGVSEDLTADLIENICHCTREQAIELTQRFAQLEIGIFIVGRRGGSSRIRWSPTLVSHANLVLNPQELEAVEVWKEHTPAKEESSSLAEFQTIIASWKRDLATKLGISSDAIDINIRI
jgi:hypothetical protein